jgi:RimJ/RimL family protein N-acetyltransferase
MEVAAMLDIANYSAAELLGNGRRIEIRSLRPDDRDELVAAVNRTSAQSLYRRFFAAKRGFTEREVAFFLNVDFVNHVALVAVLEEDGGPVICGGGRYVVVQPGTAELAFVVVDQYQGQGIGAALMRHLMVIARQAGIKELIAEVLPENAAMLKIFRKSGLRLTTRRDSDAVHVTLQLK